MSSEADLTVIGERPTGPTAASPEAVEIIDTAETRQQSGDMGSLLNRSEGVILRRSGGLGSPTNFALHGLYGNRIRFFVDGVPSELSGLGLGPADIPVNLIERVEVYKGVVPIRFGADALGGAVNFVTRDAWAEDAIETSAELAAYGTFRGSTVARMTLVPELGLVLGADAFFDRSDNDYVVDVETTDRTGKTHLETLRRFHDGYEAWGVGGEVGLRKRIWADRLTLGAFKTATTKELQHNIPMTIPYGDITLGEESVGGNLHYHLRDRRASPLGIEVLASYAQRDGRVDDVSRNLWDWHGDVIAARPTPGERGRGSLTRSHAERGAGRLGLVWRLDDHDRLELSVSPAMSSERRVTTSVLTPDRPQTWQEYHLLKVVSGLSWQLDIFEKRLKNELFVKQYYSAPKADNSSATAPQVIDATFDFGFGDALRFTLLPGLLLKASYENATRVPTPVEYFGDGNQVDASLALEPESSHNANLGVVLDGWDTPLGRFSAGLDGFYRRTRDLIFLSVVLESARYQNISDVDTTGFEAGLSWTGWKTLTLGGNLTHLSALNRSTDGFFGPFEGDRIPNLPYLYANLSASATFQGAWLPDGLEQIRPYWYGRYVHAYFLFWESQGDRQYKLEIPAQLTQDVGLSATGRDGAVSVGFEVQNMTNETVYDNIGVQLAGRSWHLKLVLGL